MEEVEEDWRRRGVRGRRLLNWRYSGVMVMWDMVGRREGKGRTFSFSSSWDERRRRLWDRLVESPF